MVKAAGEGGNIRTCKWILDCLFMCADVRDFLDSHNLLSLAISYGSLIF